MRYLMISFLRKIGGQIDEVVAVSRSLDQKAIDNTNIIVDFAEKKVVKSMIENKHHDSDFEKMREYYSNIYPALIEQLEKEAVITAIQEKKKNKLKRV